jgi:predicted RNA binding protein YcfA (HicA-like mRNA interferase family)
MHGREHKWLEILGWKDERKCSHRRYRSRWDDNIKMDLEEMKWVN